LHIGDERCYGLLHLVYDKAYKKYKFTGKDYDREGNVVSICRFYDIRPGIDGFLYTGVVTKGHTEYKNIGEFIYTAGVGSGVFMNVDASNIIRGTYNGHRINKDDIKSLLGKDTVDDRDYDTLAKLYLEKVKG
jgi:hypothetical protein